MTSRRVSPLVAGSLVCVHFTPLGVVLAAIADPRRPGGVLVPLKPLVAAIGVQWERQRQRVMQTPLGERLGACTVMVPRPVGRAVRRFRMVCIRAERVAAYVSAVNATVVHAHGNTGSARWLRAEQGRLDAAVGHVGTSGGLGVAKVRAAGRRRKGRGDGR